MGETSDSAGETGGTHRDAPTEEHDEHSRWPVVAALGAGGLYTGAGLLLVSGVEGLLYPGFGYAFLVAGALGLVVGLAGWVRQAFLADYWNRTPRFRKRRSYELATWLFLATDLGTFGALFAYYLFIRVGAWPPANLPPLLGSLVAINTALLLASSVTLHDAHEGLREGHRGRFLALLGLTFALGVAFLVGQVVEYAEFVLAEGFTLTSGIFGSAFFGLTGLHGLHVALGVILLGLAFGRALRGQYAPDRDASVTTVSLYWHFVDAVWLALVAALYVGSTVTLR